MFCWPNGYTKLRVVTKVVHAGSSMEMSRRRGAMCNARSKYLNFYIVLNPLATSGPKVCPAGSSERVKVMSNVVNSVLAPTVAPTKVDVPTSAPSVDTSTAAPAKEAFTNSAGAGAKSTVSEHAVGAVPVMVGQVVAPVLDCDWRRRPFVGWPDFGRDCLQDLVVVRSAAVHPSRSSGKAIPESQWAGSPGQLSAFERKTPEAACNSTHPELPKEAIEPGPPTVKMAPTVLFTCCSQAGALAVSTESEENFRAYHIFMKSKAASMSPRVTRIGWSFDFEAGMGTKMAGETPAAGSGTAAPATTWRELAVGVEQFRAHYKED
ncbi:hypothetical protein AK812_SmicGene8844 [Symbiodinium microadriaticum]|uniref:Uncharacterized protein n=1 Tax=Symbiodinium microadriaticum TaxID=2951 RepID=A0A1Q9EJV7_SYMMI|nr:hypothetical protein AK812_SmicGene8844 [Symbiodinium microadriaticum]